MLTASATLADYLGETTQADEPSACEKTPARQSLSTQDEGAAQ